MGRHSLTPGVMGSHAVTPQTLTPQRPGDRSSGDPQGAAPASEFNAVGMFLSDSRTPAGQIELGGCLVKLLQRHYRGCSTRNSAYTIAPRAATRITTSDDSHGLIRERWLRLVNLSGQIGAPAIWHALVATPGRPFSLLDSKLQRREWPHPRSTARRPIRFPIPPNVPARPIGT